MWSRRARTRPRSARSSARRALEPARGRFDVSFLNSCAISTISSNRRRVVARLWYPKRFDCRRSQMCRHHLPHEIVRHVAVEHGAQKRLVSLDSIVFRQKSECVVTTPAEARRRSARADWSSSPRRDMPAGRARTSRCGVEQAGRAAFGNSQRRAIGVRRETARCAFLRAPAVRPACRSALRENGRDRRSHSARGRTARSSHLPRRVAERCARRARGCAGRSRCAIRVWRTYVR